MAEQNAHGVKLATLKKFKMCEDIKKKKALKNESGINSAFIFRYITTLLINVSGCLIRHDCRNLI